MKKNVIAISLLATFLVGANLNAMETDCAKQADYDMHEGSALGKIIAYRKEITAKLAAYTVKDLCRLVGSVDLFEDDDDIVPGWIEGWDAIAECAQSRIDARSEKTSELEQELRNLIANLRVLDLNMLSDGSTLEAFHTTLNHLATLVLGFCSHQLPERVEEIASLAVDYVWLLNKKLEMVQMPPKGMLFERLEDLKKSINYSKKYLRLLNDKL